MIERFIAPALTFTVLISGHLAIAMAMFGSPAPQAAEQIAKAPVIQLETVVITGKRAAADSIANNTPTRTAQASQAAEGHGVLMHRTAE